MSAPTLTRRGRIVVGVCVLATVLAIAGDGGALNAVVLSGLVALVAGYLQVTRIDRPDVTRSRPTDGFVGERREVSLTFDGSRGSLAARSTFPGRVTDDTDDGISVLDRDRSVMAVGRDPITYGIEYVARGRRRFGPVQIDATDVFGLFERRLVVDERTTALAYPERHPISARVRRGLYAEEGIGRSPQREEFDRLREYARGDSLRDVHWPATAKHDELVVKEFSAERARRRVTVVGRTEDDGDGAAADVLASAAVSLSLAFLSDDVSVDLRLPDGTAVAAPDASGRRELLELTALTGPGRPTGEADANVRIVANAGGATVHLGTRTMTFAELHADAEDGRRGWNGSTAGTTGGAGRPLPPVTDGGELR